MNQRAIRGYVLHEQIGVGGFAAVYRAHQLAVDREVAMKIILPKHANNPEFVRRFESEAQLIARLEHIHIVPLYDYWREPNSAYLVMRWFRAGSLYDSIRANGPWDLHRAVRLVDQIASALLAAHRNGIIHQDITPANILLDDEHNAFLADFGIARDLLAKPEEDTQVYGSPAYLAPERLLNDIPSPQTDIYSFGLVLYELLTGEAPFQAPTHTSLISKQLHEAVPPLQLVQPNLPEAINAVIFRATMKNPYERFPDMLSLALAFHDAAGVASVEPVAPVMRRVVDQPGSTLPLDLPTRPLPQATIDLSAPPRNPFKGLRAFDEADAGDFFGRAALVEQLLARLDDGSPHAAFLAVIGPSGSGKSSVVKAGLLPALRQGRLAGSRDWFAAKMVPGAHPLEELEAALLSVAFGDTASIGQDLRQSDHGLHAVAQRILPPGEHTRLVLVIDQFEELFTLVADETERTHFLDSLFFALTQPDPRLIVVITLRADYYDRPLLYAGFGELVRARTEVVLPLSPDDLRETILGPALHADLVVEDDLVAAMLDDVAAQPGALPLLQYTLTELFEQRTDRALTLAAYRSSGALSGSLARRAEELYATLDPAHQRLAQQMFLRLIALGDGPQDTRRRVGWAELLSLGEGIQAVMDHFGRHRLLTFDRDPNTREPTVEVAHEALIRQWARLREWLSENRDNLRLQRQLHAAAAEWLQAERNSSYLATGSRLTQFELLAGSDSIVLNQDERDYVRAGSVLRQKARRRVQAVIAALVMLTLGALGLAAVALDRQNRANEQYTIAHSRELAVTALTNLEDLDLALLLSLKAVDVRDTLEARNSLLTALESGPHLVAFLHGQTSPVRAAAFSLDGKWAAASGQNGRVIIWETDPPRRAQVTISIDGTWANSLTFNGGVLVTGHDDGTIQRWDAQTGEPLGERMEGHTDTVWDLTISPDGGTLVSASADGSIRRWDAQTGDPMGDPITGHDDIVYGVAISPDGRLLASASADSTIRLWNLETGKAQGDPLEGPDWMLSVAFSPDGTTLAASSADGSVQQWDVESGQPVGLPLTDHTNWVWRVAYTADGQQLVSGSADHTVRVWDAASGQPIGEPFALHRGTVWDVAVYDYTILSAGADQRVILWDMQRTFDWQQTLTGPEAPVMSVAFSPDGTLLASAGGSPAGGGSDNSIRLWNAHTGKNLGILGEHADTVSAIAFSPDGDFLASASFDGLVGIWDVAERQPSGQAFTGHYTPVLSLAFSPDGDRIASGDTSGTVLIWERASLKAQVGLLSSPHGDAASLAFSPDGRLLAAGYRDGTIVLWNTTTGDPVGEPLAEHQDMVTTLAFSPDGHLLASGSRDMTIRLWNVADHQPAAPPLMDHTNWVMSVAFSPNERWLLSASRDQTLILWDVATRRPVGLPLVSHTDLVSSAAFSPDGQQAASGSWDQTIILWDLRLSTWRLAACDAANRSLTAEESTRFDISNPNVCE